MINSSHSIVVRATTVTSFEFEERGLDAAVLVRIRYLSKAGNLEFEGWSKIRS